MDKWAVSVIIPNYNNEKYLSQCLDSIIEQSYKPAEIIVVDDCSTDSSREIIKKYEEKYDIIKGIYLEENKGVSNARNKGLESAKTPYVTFTDADDYYFSKDKLKNEMELIKKFSENGKDVVIYSTVVFVNEDSSIIDWPKLKKRKFLKGKVQEGLLCLLNLRYAPRDYCVAKKVIDSVGAYCYKEDFYEDLDLLFRLSEKVEFYPTYENGVAYRQKLTGLSKRSEEEHKRAVSQILNFYLESYSKISRAKVYIKRNIKSFIGNNKAIPQVLFGKLYRLFFKKSSFENNKN